MAVHISGTLSIVTVMSLGVGLRLSVRLSVCC